MALKWFSVKTVFLASVLRGESERQGPGLAEERIVLFRARDSVDAIAMAEAEAREYECEFTSPKGERVRYEFTGSANAFELFDAKLESGTELFSSTRIVPEGMDLAALDELFHGADRDASDAAARARFSNADPI